jgi:hypothetical protein
VYAPCAVCGYSLIGNKTDPIQYTGHAHGALASIPPAPPRDARIPIAPAPSWPVRPEQRPTVGGPPVLVGKEGTRAARQRLELARKEVVARSVLQDGGVWQWPGWEARSCKRVRVARLVRASPLGVFVDVIVDEHRAIVYRHCAVLVGAGVAFTVALQFTEERRQMAT